MILYDARTEKAVNYALDWLVGSDNVIEWDEVVPST